MRPIQENRFYKWMKNTDFMMFLFMISFWDNLLIIVKLKFVSKTCHFRLFCGYSSE